MNNISSKHGIEHLRASDWGDFVAFIDSKLLFPQYVWRGQRDSTWLLEPTLDRVLRRLGKAGDTKAANEHLLRFTYATRGRRGSNPPGMASENDWWALGQHHGLATPLLDWTESPFVAAFFAYESNEPSSRGRRMVFGVSKTAAERKSKEIAKHHTGSTRPPIVECVEPFSDDNPRLVNQRALFTRSPSGMDLEEWVVANFPEDEKKVRLRKIELPETERETALRSLNRMNINHASLFPDLYGASKFANLNLEVEKY
ncbi:MAG: FRG domain-containing protein [Chloroflexi bacterium]|nr:FRG domain-containing protein [Chloroflexota bacterium]